jgi:3'(2'), 5'-bisphosphate nucleotidase
VLSEEGRNIAYDDRKNWKAFWLVDPLDGTKEFVKRNDEFTVNIALIRENRPVMGVILVPVSRVLYFAAQSCGAYMTILQEEHLASLDHLILQSKSLPFKTNKQAFTVVASRSHMSQETLEYIEGLKNKYASLDFVSVGSSLKLCLLAEGRADVYPRFGPTMEWDTAAGHAILEVSGGTVYIAGTEDPVRYNKADLLNPWFIASR